MIRERIVNNAKNLLDIMPDKFYFETLRPYMKDMWATVKFDPILTETLEKTMNQADGAAANNNYPILADSFDVLSGVLLDSKSTYQRSDSFIRANETDKEAVRELAKHIQDILTIIKCTPIEQKEKATAKKERLGYDLDKRENVLLMEKNSEQKDRL